MKTTLIACVLAGTCTLLGADATVDFSRKSGELRPALHSSGWAPRSYPRSIDNDDARVKELGMTYARTHDWALINSGQRVVDYQYVFPLFDKDAKDPSNYCFGPTDHLLSLSRNLGLKLFYRLGTSIEHTGEDVHFNARVPSDFDKTAEIFAGIVRHYNRGWANGKDWNIEYWEIWNEPDGITNMWWLPKEEGGRDSKKMRDLFVRFFVVCLKRLKSEFPEVKVGGPALCGMNEDYFRHLLKACKEAGVAPDFISWHYYGSNPADLIAKAGTARRMCDEYGFTKCELINNEWHYILSWDGIHGHNSTPAMVKRALDGPTGHNNIDSACFTLTVLSMLQRSKYDQAYYYGCSHAGNWGYMDAYKMPNKNFYACKLFGEIVRDCSDMFEVKSERPTVTLLGVKAKDGKSVRLLVSDYRGCEQVLKIAVKGLKNVGHVSAVVLDHTRDAFPQTVDYRNGELTLVKPDRNSSAWVVTFELDD